MQENTCINLRISLQIKQEDNRTLYFKSQICNQDKDGLLIQFIAFWNLCKFLDFPKYAIFTSLE